MALTTVSPGLLDSTAQYTGFKNRLINGDFLVWQRGTSFSLTAGQFCADRWASNGQSFTAAQSSDVPTGVAKYSLDITSTAGSYGTVGQKIESNNCYDLAGQNVTISFWAKRVTGTSPIYIQMTYANAADNFSAVTNIGTQTITPTSSWAQYSVTFTSLPSGVANGLWMFMYNDASANYEIKYSNVQLEKGSTATSFDYRPYGTELALCQRYYWQWSAASNGNSFFGNGFIYLAGTFVGAVQMPVQMRASPTVTTSGTAANYRIIGSGGTSYASTAVPYLDQPNPIVCDLVWTSASTPTVGQGATCLANGSTSAILGFNAEL